MAYNSQGNATQKVVGVRLQADVAGFVAGMRKAKASVNDLTKADVPKAAKAYGDLANKAALAGAAVAVGLGVAVKRFAEFDATMSAVKANVGGTASEMEALRAAAIKLGADSQFSANEAAQGINELGKAGVASADILGGGLKGALDLAAAGQIGVAQAAETTASAMTQFNLSGGEAVHVADLLASGANKAQGGVGDLSAALGQTGLVAAAMGLSIEETVGGLTAFASAGLTGSDAGTSFKTMLQRLQAPIGDAKAMLEKYNISAYDAQGNFVGLANVAGQLNQKFKTLTPEVRNNAMAVIFGADAVRASNILYNEGAVGIQKWTDAVDETGAAAKQAAALTDNLKGDLERLGGAFDSVLIESGSGANSSLRGLVQGLQGLVETIGKVPGPLLLLGGGLAAIALVAPKGVLAFREYKANLDAITQGAPRAARALNAFANAAAIGAAVYVTAQAFDELGKQLERLRGMRPEGVESAKTSILEGSDAAEQFAKKLDLTTGAVSKAQTVMGYLVLPTRLLGGAMSDLKESVGSYDTALADLVNSGHSKEAADFIAAAGLSAADAKEVLPKYAEALAGAGNAAKLAGKPTAELGNTVQDMGARLSAAAGQTDSISAAIVALGGSADAAGEDVKTLAKTIESDMGAAATAFSGDLDVLAKYDPEKATGNVKKANKASADAEKDLQNVRERIAAKKKTSVSDTQALEAATAKAAEARAAKVAAADEATGQSLSALYKDSVKTAKSFATDIQRVTEAGLDPAVVTKLLQEGPEQAGPILKQLLGDHGANLIKMVNDSEAALTALNENVVQQARLTAIAVNASSDEVTGHLDEATRIAAAKAAANGAITAEDLAAKLKLPLETVLQVAEEYGITLAASIPTEIGTGITVTGVEDAVTQLDYFTTHADEVPDTIGTYVYAPGVTAATTELGIFQTAVTDVPDGKNVDVTTTGTGPSVENLFQVKNALDGLKDKTITISTAYQTFRQGERDSQDPSKNAKGGAIYGPGTGTSDSIPALLSNGEHVLTAAEVSKLGGQSAAYALRAAIRQGNLPRFATGGAVRYAPAVTYGGPTSYSTKNDYGLSADQVTIVTNDANSFKREIRNAPYRAKARPGR